MILTGPEIQRQVELGKITIEPFDPEQATYFGGPPGSRAGLLILRQGASELV